jgi:TolB-like protein
MDFNQAGLTFGPYRFFPLTGQLFSGEQEVRLTPKAGAVLAALVAHRGHPVTKEELFTSVWRDTAVSDDALTSVIKELRKAFADDPKQPRFIETRHRRGYRFIPQIREPAAATPDVVPPKQPVVGGKPTIAVLPFENMTGDPGQDYFSDGLTEDIIMALSKHRSVLVVARSSTFAFKNHGTDVREVGVELGADYVVEGSVANTGGRLRVNARRTGFPFHPGLTRDTQILGI